MDKKLLSDIDSIQRHIDILNDETGELRDAQKQFNSTINEVKVDLAGVKTDVSWIKRFFFLVATASVGSVIASFATLLLR